MHDLCSQEKKRVLVVDDQKNWREALCDMLDPVYEIAVAASYDDASRLLWQHAFHVLVADQRLVDADAGNIQGILLLDTVAELRDGTQTIIVTAYPTIEAAKTAIMGRSAFDYLLKYPEGGGPFKIREYRERVEAAAEEAARARQKIIASGSSVSVLVAGLTPDQVAEALFPGDRIAPDVRKVVDEVCNGLLSPFQPLARGLGKAWLSRQDQICEILCWSRKYGRATMIRIGADQRSLEPHKSEWLKEDWCLTKSGEYVSIPFRGISYLIDNMTFESFALQAEDK